MNASAEENVRERNENKIPKDFFGTLYYIQLRSSRAKLFWSGTGNYSDLKWIYAVSQLVLSTQYTAEI